jgi:hypothetical protein
MSAYNPIFNFVLYLFFLRVMDPAALANNPNILNAQAFQGVQQEIINIGRRLAQMEARITNTRILAHNMRFQGTLGPLRPLQKYVSFSKNLSLSRPLAELKFDFPRMMVMAMIWHSPYVGMQLSLLPLNLSNQMPLSVTCLIHGTQNTFRMSSWTSSS